MASRLWHSAHPFQFGAIEIVGTGNFCASRINTFLSLFEVIGVVATIGIDRTVVEFEDDRTDAVQEESVVGDHEQGAVASREVAFEPFYHLQVEMVGGFVENQQIGFGE